MITKKTRAMSAVAAFLMLVSMFAMIVLPASASTYFDEVISTTGLQDASAYPDFATFTTAASATTWKVTNRAGLEKMAELVYGGNNLAGYTFIQAADIDMGWDPFVGIGDKLEDTIRFGGTYDGNGFVIENLFINKSNAKTGGLFGAPKNATIKNVGIASGLILGASETGAICGECTATTIANCWSAAAVFGSGTDGTAGIAGKATGASKIYNCYNLGIVYNYNSFASGMAGWINDANFELYNSYNAGQIITAMNNKNIGGDSNLFGYNAMIRADSASTRWTIDAETGAYSFKAGNNYYVAGTGEESYKYFIENVAGTEGKYNKTVTANDQATRVEAAALTATDATGLAAQLNSGDLTKGAPAGYTLRFENSTAGYPVLTYVKNGAVVVKRTAHTSDNVLNADKLIASSDLFKTVYENRLGGFTAEGSTKLANAQDVIEISTANDLFALAVLSMANTFHSNYCASTAKIVLTADIDCDEMDAFPIDEMLSLGQNGNLSIPIDGQNHVIKNWNTYTFIANGSGTGGLICAGTHNVSNLGMVDPVINYKWVTNKQANAYTYPAFFGGTFYAGASVFNNVFVSGGRVNYATSAGYDKNNIGAIGSRVANSVTTLTLTDCWADADVYVGGVFMAKERLVGSLADPAKTTAVYTNCAYASPIIVEGNAGGGWEPQTFFYDVSASDGSMAATLNAKGIAGNWTTVDGYTIWGTPDNATRKISLELCVGSSVVDTVNYYLNTGKSFTLPEIANYEVDETTLPEDTADGAFTVSEDVTITYLTSGVNLLLLTELIDKYEPLDLDLFVNGTEIEEFLFTLQDAYAFYTGTGDYTEDGPQDLTDPDIIDEFNSEYEGWLEIDASIDYTMVDTYPSYPNYSDYDLYAAWNTSNNWAISSKADWLALIEASKSSSMKSNTIHLLNDIDFNGTQMQPVGYTDANGYKPFDGTFDGHGYVFKNININQTMNTSPVGVFSTVGGTGVVKNFGVESGTVTVVYTNSGDGYGIGGVAGQGNSGSMFQNVWNAATVSATVSGGNKNFSISGIVGRGHGTTTLNGCYNIGKIIGIHHAAALNDWGQNSAYTFNSFGAGTLIGGNTGVIRHNTETNAELASGASDQVSNVWAIGMNFHSENAAAINEAMAAYLLKADAYETGEVGYLINQGYVSGKGERVYFTYVDGKTVHGTAANQTRKITLTAEGEEDIVFYAAAGSTVTLDQLVGATYTIADGSEGTLNEDQLTVPNADVVVNYELSGFNYNDLKAAVEAWEGVNTDYFVNGDATAALIASVSEKLAALNYADQEAIDADTAALNAARVYNDAPYLPTTAEIKDYPDAPGYVINNEADYLALAENPTAVPAEKTIYLGADITLTAASENKTLANMAASFDGLNHSVTGLKIISNLFGESAKLTYIGNVTFIDCHATSASHNDAFLAGWANNMTIENVTMQNCSSTKENADNGLGLVIGASGTDVSVTYKNILIENCVLSSGFGTSHAGNVAFLGGTLNGPVVAENIIIRNCRRENTVAVWGMGLAFGEVTGPNCVFKNIALYNNTTDGKVSYGVNGSVIGTFKTYDNSIVPATAVAENILAYGNVADGYTETEWTGNAFSGANVTEEYLVQTNVSAKYAASAYATAYANNQLEGAKTWAIEPDGDVIFATEGLPVKVTFVVGEETYAYYTDNTGAMLLADSEMIAANEWDKEIAAVHTEDTVYTAKTCEHVMAEEWTHVEGTETHKRICTLGCGHEEIAACEYTTVVTDPTCCAAGYTTKTCTVCGNVIVEAGAPATGEHVWGDWYVDTPATTTAPGVEKRVCTTEGCTAFETREIPVLEFEIGNVNGDSAMNSADVVMLMRRVASGTNPEGFVEAAADINGDGQINSSDTVALMKKVSSGT